MSRLFGPMRQLGLVVRDFESGMRFWSDAMGVGPFFARRNIAFENYRYRGRPAEAPIVSASRTFTGDFNIEIITQENDAPSAYTEFLASGREGPQHVAYWYDTPGYDAARERARQCGLAPVMEGELAMGAFRGRFVYLERSPGDPLMIELTEALQPAFVPMHERQVEIAAAWDGRDPIR